MYIATIAGTIAGALAALVLFSFLMSYPAYLLWNGCLVGAVDGVNEVTWLQIWGISFLSSILFKNSTVKKN